MDLNINFGIIVENKGDIFLNKLGFLLSKKILVLLSGVVFTSVAFASSGAQSLFQDSAITMPKTKIPEVQKVEESTEASSSPAPAIAKQASTKRNTPAAPKPTVKPAAVAVTVQPVVVQPAPAKTPTSLAPTVSSPAKSPAPAKNFISSRSEDEDEDEERENDEDSDSHELYQAFQRAYEDDEDDD